MGFVYNTDVCWTYLFTLDFIDVYFDHIFFYIEFNGNVVGYVCVGCI